eukprot:EG_transcript_14839
MVSTGKTTNVLSPTLAARLRVPTRPWPVQTTEGTVTVEAAFLSGVRLAGEVPITFFSATVQPFPQVAWAAAQGATIDGILGMEFLEQCDLSYQEGTLRVFGTRAGWLRAAQQPEWRPVAGFPLAQRLMAVQAQAEGVAQPLFAVVDTGRLRSAVNSDAAELLGMTGTDGARATVRLSVCPIGSAEGEVDGDGQWRLSLAPAGAAACVPFRPVEVERAAAAEAFLAAATFFPERGVRSYCGPMLVLGQDVLSQ